MNNVKILVGGVAVRRYPAEMPAKARKKRPSAYHHGDLRDALVRAARRILEKEGIAQLSLRRVARAAGVSPAAPYHHFADKQALLDAIATQGFAGLTTEMRARMARESDPAGRLDASGVGYVVFAVENPTLFQLMFSGDGRRSSGDTALKAARDSAYGVLQAAVADTSVDGTANPLVCLRLWSLVHGIAKLIVERSIKPSDYGAADSEALAVRVLRSEV